VRNQLRALIKNKDAGLTPTNLNLIHSNFSFVHTRLPEWHRTFRESSALTDNLSHLDLTELVEKFAGLGKTPVKPAPNFAELSPKFAELVRIYVPNFLPVCIRHW
jgi:5-bromo-4-chloroindolyl phosphate hydrolysis protein